MRLALSIVVISLLIAVSAAHFMVADSGYVLLAYGGWTVELSLWLAALINIGLIAMVYLAARLVIHLTAKRGRLRSWAGQRRNRLYDSQLQQGLFAYLDGNWDKAISGLSKAAKRGNEQQSQLPLLFAVKASEAGGDLAKAKSLIDAAESRFGANKSTVDLAKAELEMQAGQLETALAILHRLKKSGHAQDKLDYLLLSCYERLGEWASLAALLEQAPVKKLLDKSTYERLQSRSATHNFAQASDLASLHAQWQALTRKQQKQASMVAAYVGALMTHNGHEFADKILNGFFKRQWDDALLSLYAQVQSPDPDRQLLLAESWLVARPNNAELLICLARLCLRNELWGKALDYYESAIAHEPRADIYAEFARLLAHQGKLDRSNKLYEKSFLAQHPGLANLPLPKS